VTALIVDDHEGFRESARSLLALAGVEVVGEAFDGQGGLALARELAPDLVLLDISLPDMSGFVVAEELAALPSPPVVVLVSNRGRLDMGTRVRGERVRGFIPKEELTLEALEALLPAGR
jgi:DNA-binding NarL/FixJ family response regulator